MPLLHLVEYSPQIPRLTVSCVSTNWAPAVWEVAHDWLGLWCLAIAYFVLAVISAFAAKRGKARPHRQATRGTARGHRGGCHAARQGVVRWLLPSVGRAFEQRCARHPETWPARFDLRRQSAGLCGGSGRAARILTRFERECCDGS